MRVNRLSHHHHSLVLLVPLKIQKTITRAMHFLLVAVLLRLFLRQRVRAGESAVETEMLVHMQYLTVRMAAGRTRTLGMTGLFRRLPGRFHQDVHVRVNVTPRLPATVVVNLLPVADTRPGYRVVFRHM